MPLYCYSCPKCGEVDNVWAHHTEDRKVHEECGSTMSRLISLANIQPDMAPYVDHDMAAKPVPIKSRRHHRQMMKEHGVSLR